MARACRRRGFSLIELLVVIGIVGLLIAMLLPALQETRSAARKIDCQSRLRQMGLAIMMYHDTYRMLPPGCSAPPIIPGNQNHPYPRPNDALTYKRMYSSFGWATRLLPYLDQGPLYDKLDIDGRSLEDLLNNDPDSIPLVQMRLEIFRCPVDLADDTMETAPIVEWAATLGNDTQVFGGSSSYVGNCGLAEPQFPLLIELGPADGVFFTNSQLKLADITDGLSQTIAVGERAWFQGSATWAGTQDVHGEWGSGNQAILGRVFYRINEIPDPPGVQITPADDLIISSRWSSRSGFSSYHPGGAYFLFADGSVRFLNENLESRTTTTVQAGPHAPIPNPELLGTFQRLGIRNDGLPVGEY